MRENWGRVVRVGLGALLMGLVLAGFSPLATAEGGVRFTPRLDQVTEPVLVEPGLRSPPDPGPGLRWAARLISLKTAGLGAALGYVAVAMGGLLWREPAVQALRERVADWPGSFGWGLVRGAGKALLGVAVAVGMIAGAVLLGVSTPVLLVAGSILLLGGMGLAVAHRVADQKASGQSPRWPATLGVAALDAVGVAGIVEGLRRKRLLTGVALDPEAAGEALGGGLVYTLALGLGGRRLLKPNRPTPLPQQLNATVTMPVKAAKPGFPTTLRRTLRVNEQPIGATFAFRRTPSLQKQPLISSMITNRPHRFQHDVLNPGPLHPDFVGNFAGGKYSVVTLTRDRIFYRAGKAGRGFGQWLSLRPSRSEAQVRIDNALRRYWLDRFTGMMTGQSPVDTVFAIKIPKGTPVYIGPINTQGGIYLGNRYRMQVFVSEPWKLSGAEIVNFWRLVK